jgi:hypothetical protein
VHEGKLPVGLSLQGVNEEPLLQNDEVLEVHLLHPIAAGRPNVPMAAVYSASAHSFTCPGCQCIAGRCGFGDHLADVGIDENDAWLPGLGKRILRAFRDQRTLFLRECRLNVQHERVNILAQRRDDERGALGHQTRNEVNIAT